MNETKQTNYWMHLVIHCSPGEMGYYISSYRVTKNDCQGFNNLSYIIHLRQEYVVAPMDQEILKVFFYDEQCAVVMHFSAWSAVY